MKKLFVLLSLFFVTPSFALTCTGTVTSATDGLPIIGTTVMIKGTTTGTIADIDGNFSIPNCKRGDTLQFSFIGYVTREFCVNNQISNLDIVLCEEGTGSCNVPNNGAGAGCGSSGGGGTGCTSCSNCTTTSWSEYKPGYESRVVASCNLSTCVCTKKTEYRCADGYVGETTDGETGCSPQACDEGTCCGTVRDTDGYAISGATVVVKDNETGSISGVTSDLNGYFKLYNCGVNDKITFLYLGFVRQDHTVNNTYMDIVMEEDSGEISCDSGYYIDWSDGYSKCVECPSFGNVAGQIPASNSGLYENDITYCYVPAGTSSSDSTGTYQYTDKCYYE